jgi:exodeoxyribonuclease VII small subunit
MNAQPPKPAIRFEERLAELQQVIEQLEDGQLGLDQALESYERGVGLLKQCHELLEKAERRIELLKGVNAQNQPDVTSFDEGSLTLDEKAARRGRRRTHADQDGQPRSARKTSGDVDDRDRLF